jgi:hypothetical protein
MRAAQVKAGVCVHLNKPDVKVGIDHEVIPQDLKAALIPLHIDQVVAGLHSVCNQFPYLRQNLLGEIDVPMFSAKVLLEIDIG